MSNKVSDREIKTINKKIMSKKLVVLCVLLLVLLVGVMIVYSQTTQKSPKNIVNKPDKVTDEDIVKTEVEFNKLPDKLPTDLPLEEGANILQNYNATSKDGRFQATRVFETNQSLATNLNLYKSYLTKAGYTIKTTVNQSSYKMIFGTKGNNSLQISIDQNAVTAKSSVSISYTEQPESVDSPSQSR